MNQYIRGEIVVFNYLNHSDVGSKLISINDLLREQIRLAQNAYNAAAYKELDLVECWDKFFENRLNGMAPHARRFIEDGIRDMRGVYTPETDSLNADWINKVNYVNYVNLDLDLLEFAAEGIRFGASNLH